VCQSHCRLAIYIKKYLKAKEDVWKLMRSPTSINENITYVYILKAKNSTPNLTSHRHPQVKLIARVSVAGVSPAHHWGFEHRTFFWFQDPEGSIAVNGHHPAPNPKH